MTNNKRKTPTSAIDSLINEMKANQNNLQERAAKLIEPKNQKQILVTSKRKRKRPNNQKANQGNKSYQKKILSNSKQLINDLNLTSIKGLKIIPLGGQEEVGRNMTVFEYGEDIVILDMGLQFPEEDMPGVDYIVPDVSYLKGKEKRIRGVIFSHGHLDHIGAAPILLQQLNYQLLADALAEHYKNQDEHNCE